MSGYTDAELTALRAAYAAGILSVSYEGRTVTYATGNDLLARIREIERDTGASKPSRASFASFSRGY